MLEALLKITSQEGRGDVSSDTRYILLSLNFSLFPSYSLLSMNQEWRNDLSLLLKLYVCVRVSV